jgi:dihydroneopterin aldolase
MPFPHLTNRDDRLLDQVQLTGMLMSCVIGIFPSERSRKQPVTIDMCLYLDTRRAAASANIHETIDYAGAVKEVSFILDHCEFLLIETAVEAICRHFLLTYQTDHNLPAVEAVMVRISKPSALTHGIVPAVQILRRKDDLPVSPAPPTHTALTLIHSAADASLHMLVSDNHSGANIFDILPHASAALPLGRWNLNGMPLKNRVPVHLTRDQAQVFTLSDGAQGRGIILLQGHP